MPKALSIEAPLGSEAEGALAMLELIEQRAAKAGVAVDSRIERGRTPRHALESLMDQERFDTIALPAATSSSDGFSAADVAWALESAPGEVLVLRPGPGLAIAQAGSKASGSSTGPVLPDGGSEWCSPSRRGLRRRPASRGNASLMSVRAT